MAMFYPVLGYRPLEQCSRHGMSEGSLLRGKRMLQRAGKGKKRENASQCNGCRNVFR